MSRNVIVALILLGVVLYYGVSTDGPRHETPGAKPPQVGASSTIQENTSATAGAGSQSGSIAPSSNAASSNAGRSAPQDVAAGGSKAPSAPTSTANANGTTSTAREEYLPTETDINKNVTAFLRDEYFRDKPRYLERVDYFERGVVSRDAVLQDTDRYARRWPQRTFELVPGSVQVTPKGGDRYVASFDYTYAVSNGSRQLSGRASGVLALVVKEGQFYVAGVREEVTRDRR